jgi:hypothetical protein
MMLSLGDAVRRGTPGEVTFAATVTSQPHFFYGTRTHAEHEAFFVQARDGTALEVVDNVLLAPPVPVQIGDRIRLRGELVPQTSHGPIVHWTHHDPAHRHIDGFIDAGGRRYA